MTLKIMEEHKDEEKELQRKMRKEKIRKVQ